MVQGGNLINIAITREDKEIIYDATPDDYGDYLRTIGFDTVVEIG